VRGSCVLLNTFSASRSSLNLSHPVSHLSEYLSSTSNSPAVAKPSFYLSDDELAIVDATAKRMGISRSEVVRHLILYHGLCGGDFPLTRKIVDLPPVEREKVTAEIRRRAEANQPVKPQRFREWVIEALGSDDPSSMERSAEALLRNLLK
jgi:hypothetical protein